jgi:hypothetical protein
VRRTKDKVEGKRDGIVAIDGKPLQKAIGIEIGNEQTWRGLMEEETKQEKRSVKKEIQQEIKKGIKKRNIKPDIKKEKR